MRLSDWRRATPHRESLGPRVLAVLEPVLATLGAERDPHVWIAWGEDPGDRYTLFAITPGGLGTCMVRVNPSGEGPRIRAKLVRWGRVQVGDLDVETQESHRLLTVQLEGHVLKGVDADGDAVARFVHAVLAAVDGRPMPNLEAPASRRRRVSAAAPGSVAHTPSKASAKRPAAAGKESGSRSGKGSGKAPTRRSAG